MYSEVPRTVENRIRSPARIPSNLAGKTCPGDPRLLGVPSVPGSGSSGNASIPRRAVQGSFLYPLEHHHGNSYSGNLELPDDVTLPRSRSSAAASERVAAFAL